MTEIRLYPSTFADAPIERHESLPGETIGDFLARSCQSYSAGPTQPVTVSVDGCPIPPSAWADRVITDRPIDIRPVPRGLEPGTWLAIIMAAISIGMSILMRPKKRDNNRSQEDIATADIDANQPKPNGIIPEICGLRKTYPDMLCQFRRYFVDDRTQAIDAMLCIGVGHYAIDEDNIFIGATPLASLAADLVDYQIFGPDADVSGHQAHRNWYNAPEVGASTGSAGLRLIGSIETRFRADRLAVASRSIIAVSGSGLAPQSWEVDMIVRITMMTRSMSVAAGGGSARDIVTGEFGDLGLVIGDPVLIVGSDNAGTYRVNSLSPSSGDPGTPSTASGTVYLTAGLAGSMLRIHINADQIYIDRNYNSLGEMIDDINGQLTAHVADLIDLNPGAAWGLRITEKPPYSGKPIVITGNYTPLLGEPTKTTGTATTADSVTMTLDRRIRTQTGVDENGQPIYVYSWSPANDLVAGDFSGLDVQRASIVETDAGDDYRATAYRIAALAHGGWIGQFMFAVTGFVFVRQLPAGGDDANWSWFYPPGEYGSDQVIVELDLADDAPDWLGPFRATPEIESAQIFELDFFAPQGLGDINDSGGISTRSVDVQVQWRSDGGPWSTLNYSLSGASADQLGWTFSAEFPSALPRVDFRVSRITPESDSLQAADRVEWYGLRCQLPAPSAYAGVTTMALTLRGSDKISDNAENKINVIAARRYITDHFKGPDVSAGYISAAGAFVPNAQWATTPMIAIKGHGQTVIAGRGSSGIPAATAYDGQGRWLGVVCQPSSSGNFRQTLDFSKYPAAVYYRGVARSDYPLSLIETIQSRAISDWVRYVIANIGYPDSEVNQAALTELEAVWDTRGDYYDAVVADETTVKEALADALLAGFAELTIDNGQIRPVRDQPRTTFEHLYTPQNMTDPLTREFSAYEPDDADGVDVEYTDAETWETATVQCRLPGDVGAKVESIKLTGVTDRTRAWRIGMRRRRAMRYQRKTYSFATEYDALNSRYLSYCALADDIPGYGQSAIVEASDSTDDGVEITSSEPLSWVAMADHVIAFRRPDGTLSGPYPATRIDDWRLSIPSIDFEPITGASAIEPTHLIFGTTTRWSYPVLITEISPSAETVKVSAINYDERVYADDDNSPPAP